MDKQELLSQLNNAQNNFMLGIAALGLLVQEESRSILEKLLCVMTETSILFISDVSQVRSHFQNTQFPIEFAPYPLIEAADYIKSSDEDQIQRIQQEFCKMLLRSLLKESFETIKEYCSTADRSSLFKQQDWYHFARITRNCLSHNFLIEYGKYDKEILPVGWKGKSFTLDMDGKPLDTSLLSIAHALELYKNMRMFVENSL